LAKLYSLKAGAKVPEDILSIARREKIATARVEAIGGVRKLRLAFFNHDAKKYEEHDYNEFLEVTSMLGNITTKDGGPFLHAHGNFGRRDLTVLGGHIMSAEIFPILEVVVTPTSNRALRKFDDALGLNVIYKA
jgi:predicted DNA-binding protein with PD1-like motif